MPHAGLSAAVAGARRAVTRPGDAPSDGELLAAFLATRDAAAFAELVRRLGPMVLAVCRRVTGHHQDAEDAFQAAFVVLARKAAAVSPREAVGNFLYGVAVRVAREARAVSARRRAREVPTARLPDVARPEPAPDDLHAVLYEELADLPEKFRTLIVLCDLRGEPQTAVAERLGLAVGTVYSRLSAARKLLGERLGKRGVGVPAALACGAAVPPALAARAVVVALSPKHASAAVAALTTGVFRTMFLQKLTATGVVALAVALAVAAATPDPTPAGTGRPTAAPVPAPAPAPRPVPAAPAAIQADGKKLAEAPPVVVKTVPESGADAVDPALAELSVTFSKVMDDGGFTWSTAPYGDFPETKGKPKFDKAKKTCTLAVKLEPGKTYAIWLNSEKFQNFTDPDGRPAVPYLLVFQTKAK